MRGVGHRDALDLLGGIDEQRLVDHDAQRSRTLRLATAAEEWSGRLAGGVGSWGAWVAAC